MQKLFGTDGMRGSANRWPLNVETVVAVGKAVVEVLGGGLPSPSVIIGQDTRRSCGMLSCAMAAGAASMGAGVRLAGVVPTPAVAFLTRLSDAVAGVVISASHNPYQDNGIKLFGGDGFKLDDEVEAAVEKRVHQHLRAGQGTAPGPEAGAVERIGDAVTRYRSFLAQAAPRPAFLTGVRLVVDCANGATYRAAPQILRALGAGVETLSVSPDGYNINRDCGSQHLDKLIKKVVAASAHVGLAFDGDGDRLIAVDECGQPLSGDRILAICARHLLHEGRLPGRVVVTTVMSNFGFRAAMADLGIRCAVTDVGDRRVMQRMRTEGAVIGGEDSGHTIFLDHHTTGDGILTAIRLLEAMAVSGRPLSELARVMTVLPQVLINVAVRHKPSLESVPEIASAVRRAEARLGSEGRVLLRYSGTEQKCRVMVEGPSEELTGSLAKNIADKVRNCLGEGQTENRK